jgi:peptidoglycan hydrolase-like protein with peptidoglycan-binding domain
MDPLTIGLFVLFALEAGGAAATAPSVPSSGTGPTPKPKPKPSEVTPKASAPLPVGKGVSVLPSLTDTSFPGPRWELDSPPSAAVQARAVELIPVLWAKGAGAGIIQDMGASMGVPSRPTAFRAEAHGTKKAVSAWRLKSGTVLAPTLPPLSQQAMIEKAIAEAPKRALEPLPVVAPSAPVAPEEDDEEALPADVVVVREVEAEPVQVTPVSLEEFPVLKKGMRGPEVTRLQRAFGWNKVTDFFGDQTEAKVKEIQRTHSLPVTGVADQDVWEVLLGSA